MDVVLFLILSCHLHYKRTTCKLHNLKVNYKTISANLRYMFATRNVITNYKQKQYPQSISPVTIGYFWDWIVIADAKKSSKSDSDITFTNLSMNEVT